MCIWNTILFLKPWFWFSFHSVSSFVNAGTVRSCRSSKAVLGFGCCVSLHRTVHSSVTNSHWSRTNFWQSCRLVSLLAALCRYPPWSCNAPYHQRSTRGRNACRLLCAFRTGYENTLHGSVLPSLLPSRSAPRKPVKLPAFREIYCSAQGWQESGLERNTLCLLFRAIHWRAAKILHFSIATGTGRTPLPLLAPHGEVGSAGRWHREGNKPV